MQSSEIQNRIHSALVKPPLCDVIYQDGQFVTHYEAQIQAVQNICRDFGVCNHDALHCFNVGQNTLILKDLVITSNPALQSDEVLHDEILLIPSFMHDLGYSDTNVAWEGLDAINHSDSSVKIFDGLLLQLWFDTNKSSVESLDVIDKHIFLLRAAIGMTTQEALRHTHYLAMKKTASRDLSAQDVYPILAKAADCLDLFSDQRIMQLPEPEIYHDNPYYFLAKSVSEYHLLFNRQKYALQYEVLLHQGVDFDWWYEQTWKHYPETWQLTTAFTKLLGWEFEVKPTS